MSAASFLLGLTGGIGSGKSTVANLLAKHQRAAVIDADAISRSTTAVGGSALAGIAATFGPHLVAPDGAMDRAAMRDLVYKDPEARQRLEAIIHPLVAQETDRQLADARQRGAPLVVFDVPLLAESGPRWRARVDRILVIDCDRDTQIQRVMARNALPRDQVERILAAQARRAQRLACADAVAFNGAATTLPELRRQIDAWARRFGL